VKFHPNSNYLATGSSDKTVRLWDISRGNCVRVFSGHNGPVQALAFSQDGTKLATAGDDKYVHIWDISSGTRIKKMGGHRGCVTSLAFSQEDSLLASSGLDGSVRIWDILRSEEDDSPMENVHAKRKKKKVLRCATRSFNCIVRFYSKGRQ
jgi:transcription initiation factor TFIID subunit 5